MLTRNSHNSHCFIDSNTSMVPQTRSLKSSSPLQHHDTSSSTFTLENVVRQYAAQPELLELILSSKVEEDRRRAEEAKLKQKEIDYVLQQQQQQKDDDNKDANTNTISQRDRSSQNSYQYQPWNLPPISPPPSTLQPSLSPSSDCSLQQQQQQQQQQQRQRANSSIGWRSSAIILPPLTSSSTSSSSSASSSSSTLSPSLSAASFSPNLGSESSRFDATFNKQALPPSPKRNHSLSEVSSSDMNHKRMTMEHHHQHRRPQPPSAIISPPSPPPQTPVSPPVEKVSPKTATTTVTGLKRRRREMQAITTIIETKEFPYNDDYLWRNNGNTVHRKTGNKSIYYKCANSQQGCPVNKTCTLRQDTGEYLIKYRGTHLLDCSTIKRINDV
ncbi:hypothetical protein BCR42DRAFT_401198 [Absidia repens]|uniref:WRKY domain-containing protein n=1 Tax=Absidia repens TaxID=90262 RepID=A0A1X2J3V4_9FUNG|nr:hypothetical protein BCR42DRAFT_401198 [Absidia repens]